MLRRRCKDFAIAGTAFDTVKLNGLQARIIVYPIVGPASDGEFFTRILCLFLILLVLRVLTATVPLRHLELCSGFLYGKGSNLGR